MFERKIVCHANMNVDWHHHSNLAIGYLSLREQHLGEHAALALNIILTNRMHDACPHDQIKPSTDRYFNGVYFHTFYVSDESRDSGDFCAI